MVEFSLGNLSSGFFEFAFFYLLGAFFSLFWSFPILNSAVSHSDFHTFLTVEFTLGIHEEKKNKHMTLEDRIEIQECLAKGMTFKAIGKRIGKDPTTISKEVKLHGQTYTNSFTKTDESCPKLMKAPTSIRAVAVRALRTAVAYERCFH